MIEHTIKQGTMLVFKEKDVWAIVSSVDVVVPVIEGMCHTPVIHVSYTMYGKGCVVLRKREGLPLGALMSSIDSGAIIEVRNPTTGGK